jgi:hypothetical protein
MSFSLGFSEGSTPKHEKNYRNTKKYVLSEKNPKNCMRIIKKMIGIPIQPIKSKKNPKKALYSASKVKKSQKFEWGASKTIGLK